jgi:hypothetical protein
LRDMEYTTNGDGKSNQMKKISTLKKSHWTAFQTIFATSTGYTTITLYHF